MTAITIFYQQCPVCGRSLRIPTKYFGRQMTCTHCEGEFCAGKEELQPPVRACGTDMTNGVLETRGFVQPQLGEV
jgi:hypothetical protein